MGQRRRRRRRVPRRPREGRVLLTDLGDVLLTSVAATERGLADEHFAGARIRAESLSEPLARANADVRVVVVQYADRPTPSALATLPRLMAVVTRSDGFDHLPADAMKSRGVAGYHLEGYATEAVAHHAVVALAALLRRVPEAAARTREGSRDRAGIRGRSLLDATVGVVGAGRIGGEVARLLSRWGVRVLLHDLRRDPRLEALDGVRYARDLDDLLRRADALTVHVPLTEATRRLLGRRELDRLPRGAVLVNTARGDVVDQAAVEDALREGRLAGYAADVLPGEPDPREDLARFRAFPNVLLTPHVAAYDDRTVRERWRRAARIARALTAGRASEVERFRCV